MMRRIGVLLVVAASVFAVAAASALAVGNPPQASGSPPVNSSPPTVAGSAAKGQTLTAASGSWTGLTPITYAYQWQRCNSSGSSCGSIGRATSQNYVVSSGDVGRTLRVAVTAKNDDGSVEALSGATAAITNVGSAPANTKQPNPSGTAQEGQTIRVDDGNWSGLKPIAFSYQWQTCTAANSGCTDIPGVTGSSYVIGIGQVGSKLRAVVTATNSAGKNSASSNLTTAVTAKVSAPVNSSLPMISGSVFVGQTLHASTGVWSGAPSGFTYQWTRCNSNGSSCSSISGATGQTYGIGVVDRGTALRVNVTATNANGTASATSAASRIGTRAVAVTASFNAVLRPGQEVVHPKRVSSRTAGHMTAKLSGKTLRWTMTFSHLTGRPNVATLNKGVRGTNGTAFKTLCRYCVSPAHGTVTLTASQVDALLRGRTYVNVLTARNTHGELRGQINRVS